MHTTLHTTAFQSNDELASGVDLRYNSIARNVELTLVPSHQHEFSGLLLRQTIQPYPKPNVTILFIQTVCS